MPAACLHALSALEHVTTIKVSKKKELSTKETELFTNSALSAYGSLILGGKRMECDCHSIAISVQMHLILL